MKLRYLLTFLVAGTLASAAAPVVEIQELIGFLRNLDGAVFIRNGSEYTPAEAADHLRTKWDKQREKIKSAEDFIALCGSKSSTSGQRYQIRFKGGEVRNCEAVLRDRLRELRAAAEASQKSAQPRTSFEPAGRSRENSRFALPLVTSRGRR